MLEKSNGDMMKAMQMMMMQHQFAMEDEAAERRAERELREHEREIEEMRREREREENRKQREEEANEARCQERRQDRKMNQFMQMAFAAFMMYNSRSANPSMFPTLSESDDNKSDKKPSSK